MGLSSADFFREAFDYGYWARDRLLARVPFIPWHFYVNSAELDHGTMHKTLIHVLDYEATWRRRIQGAKVLPAVTEAKLSTLEALQEAWAADEQEMRAYLADLTDEDLARTIDYTRREGDQASGVLWQLLFQVINHGTHHRSEVAFGLTRYGHSPGDLDYIAYVIAKQA